ncbi:plasmid mobilization relaxosome protein MobC [Rhodococcoides fascians]|uniref:plasmid mobilization relaxosome protein MobC n=1 Tax=Rhodococcoides fascians TaxID=1828 RepID=UPI00068D1D1F|nr:plasmid mobilization relaxosome protein MobC [Rhodococcus fascians]
MSEQSEGKMPGSAAKNIARSLRRRRLPNVDGGRPFAHQVMASAEEEAAIQARARVLGVTVPRLLLEAALTPTAGSVTGLPPADKLEITDRMYGLSVSVRQVGRNINQIAKATNATGAVDSDLASELSNALTALQETLVRIDAAMLDVSR